MQTSRKLRTSVALAYACLIASCASTHARKTTPGTPSAETEAESAGGAAMGLKGELAARESLPPAARAALTMRMDRHGEVMTYLFASLIFLQYDDAEYLASQIAEEPKLGRPREGDTDSLNALLPAAFFDYQDELMIHAAELSAAARSHDDAKLVEAFGKVSGTCVACHSAYLNEEADPELDDLDAEGPLSRVH